MCTIPESGWIVWRTRRAIALSEINFQFDRVLIFQPINEVSKPSQNLKLLVPPCPKSLQSVLADQVQFVVFRQ